MCCWFCSKVYSPAHVSAEGDDHMLGFSIIISGLGFRNDDDDDGDFGYLGRALGIYSRVLDG